MTSPRNIDGSDTLQLVAPRLYRAATFEEKALNEEISAAAGHEAPVFERSGYQEVDDFFRETSEHYDSDKLNPYWSFAHDVLKFILLKFVTDHFPPGKTIRLLDAGAGTGNWSSFLLGIMRDMQVTMFDRNDSMLRIAREKLSHAPNKVQIIEGNLEVASDMPAQKFDLILCMHNVIGLARNTARVLANLHDHLEEDGVAFVMATNKYHAFKFLQRLGREKEVLRVLKDGSVKFKAEMPEMFCYTPSEFQAVLEAAGFQDVKVLGFPVTVYPSAEDTKLLRTSSDIASLLNPGARRQMLELEKRLCLHPELAYRGGSSLIAICKKLPSKKEV